MKVYLAAVLVVGHDGLGEGAIKSALDNHRYLAMECLGIEGREIGEWSDDNPLNFKSTVVAEVERLFRGDDVST